MKLKHSLSIIFILFQFIVFAQNVKIIVKKLPEKHNFKDSVFAAGSFNNWNPHDLNYLLKNDGNNQYSITFECKYPVDFKFTKGSWNSVEKDKSCNEIKNRRIDQNTEKELICEIENWADFCGNEKTHTANEFVSVINEKFPVPQLNTTRRIWIYLPPDYNSPDTKNKKYPVLYMHDGQNLFDAFYSFAGEWGIDETLTELFNENPAYSCIVVGIDNGGAERLNEYSPWKNLRYGGGKGDEYIDFIANSLKPYIDKNYRTLSDKENTGIMGSSMGGLISYYAGLKYNDVFGKIGIFSPSFWFSKEVYKIAEKTKGNSTTKFYFLAGEKEDSEGDLKGNCEKIIKLLQKSGFENNNIKFVYKSDGEHSEWFWKREFADAYKFLYSK